MTDTEPQSPCIRSCTLDENDMCLGCFRMLNEIVGWGSRSADEKRAILSRLEERRSEHERKYGNWRSAWKNPNQ